MVGAVGITALAFSACAPPAAEGTTPATDLAADAASGALAEVHGTGLLPVPVEAPQGPSLRSVTAAPPVSFDLTQWAPPAGDQGNVGSCVAWSIAYTALGWYQRHDRIGGGALAPMYTYAQVAKGRDTGSSFQSNLAIAKTEGIDTQADYQPQGNFDFTTQPTAAQRTNAAKWKLSSYTALPVEQVAIQSSISSGHPVVIGMAVYSNFFSVNSANRGYYDATSGSLAGYHAITALGYDASGLRILNSWSRNWGDNGYATLSWNFVRSNVFSAIEIGAFAPGAPADVAPVTTTTARPATTTTTTIRPTTTTTTTIRPATTTTVVPQPVVAGLSPAVGTTAGGTVVTVTGSNLKGGIVTIGTTRVVGSVNASGTSLTFRTPQGSGVTPVTVATGGGSVTAGSFNFQIAPRITTLSANRAARTASTNVTIGGVGFNVGTVRVQLGSKVLVPSTTSADGTSLVVTIPPGTRGVTTIAVRTDVGVSPATIWTYL